MTILAGGDTKAATASGEGSITTPYRCAFPGAVSRPDEAAGEPAATGTQAPARPEPPPKLLAASLARKQALRL